MENKVDRTNELTEFIQEKLDEALSWMGPENTLGDFITVFVENMADKIIGEELLAVSVNELDNNREKANECLKKLKERDKFGIFDGLHLV